MGPFEENPTVEEGATSIVTIAASASQSDRREIYDGAEGDPPDSQLSTDSFGDSRGGGADTGRDADVDDDGGSEEAEEDFLGNDGSQRGTTAFTRVLVPDIQQNELREYIETCVSEVHRERYYAYCRVKFSATAIQKIAMTSMNTRGPKMLPLVMSTVLRFFLSQVIEGAMEIEGNLQTAACTSTALATPRRKKANNANAVGKAVPAQLRLRHIQAAVLDFYARRKGSKLVFAKYCGGKERNPFF